MKWDDGLDIGPKWIITPADLEGCKALHPELVNDPEFKKIEQQIREAAEAEIMGSLKLPTVFDMGKNYATTTGPSPLWCAVKALKSMKDMMAMFPPPPGPMPAATSSADDMKDALKYAMGATGFVNLMKPAKFDFKMSPPDVFSGIQTKSLLDLYDKVMGSPSHRDPTLRLAGRVFDRNISVLSRVHRLGVWRFQTVRAIGESNEVA